MAQSDNGRVRAWEDFVAGSDDDILAVADADGLRFNDIFISAVSGQLDIVNLLTEPNGVWRFNGAGGAGDGFALTTSPFQPSTQGTITAEVRFKASAVDAFRFFFGMASTIDRDEPVSPFTLSGTTLTSNNAGSAFGFYFDTAATTDDVRFQSSVAGVAQTTVVNGVDNTALGSLGKRVSTTLVADSYIYMRVEIDDSGSVRAYYSDVTVAPQGTGYKHYVTLPAGTVDRTAFLRPYFICLDVSTGDANFDVDFFGAWGGRDWSY